MKPLLTILTVLSTVFLLQACGSSSNKTNVAMPTTPPTTPTVPEAVHTIQPEDVPAYIENFKIQNEQVELQLDGVKYALSFIDLLQEQGLILVKFDLGVILIAFDAENEKPGDRFSILEGDISDIEKLLENPTRILNSDAIVASEENDNTVYTGTLIDPNTQGLFNVKMVFNESIISAGDSEIEVVDEQAFVNGTLGTSTYVQMMSLINDHPEVKTLVLQEIDGSVNDAINMHTGRLVRNAQLTTRVSADGDINSGGVDLFAAGFERIYKTGGKLGVHSWCCGENNIPANELERDDPAHGAQLTYFREMLGQDLGPEFYFFTLDAAPFETVHVMTQEELDKFLLN